MPFYSLVHHREHITSPQNERVKNLVRLREGKHRRRQSRFLLEGLREITRAFKKNVQVDEFYYCPDFTTAEIVEPLIARAQECKAGVFELSRQAFEKASARENPDGILGAAPMWDLGLDRVKLSASPLLLIAEGVEKPGNLGTLLRTADGAGADAVIITDPVTDVFNPNVIRASQGALFSQVMAVSGKEALAEWLCEHGITAFATTPDGAVDFWDTDMRGPTAILMGREHEGLSDFWLKEREEVRRIKIPMRGISDSLNVSASAAVFLYEAVRQRA